MGRRNAGDYTTAHGRRLVRAEHGLFTFRFESSRALVQGVPGLRIPTEAWLGPRILERFGVDLVTKQHGRTPPPDAQAIRPSTAGSTRGFHRGQGDGDRRDSPRPPEYPVWRLADLVLIAHSQSVRADDLAAAFR